MADGVVVTDGERDGAAEPDAAAVARDEGLPVSVGEAESDALAVGVAHALVLSDGV